MTWRKRVDPAIKNHLELQIREATRHKEAYSKSKHKAIAQLWCAIANISQQNFDLNLRIKLLESVLKDMSQKSVKEPIKKKKISKKTKKLVKSLKRL